MYMPRGRRRNPTLDTVRRYWYEETVEKGRANAEVVSDAFFIGTLIAHYGHSYIFHDWAKRFGRKIAAFFRDADCKRDVLNEVAPRPLQVDENGQTLEPTAPCTPRYVKANDVLGNEQRVQYQVMRWLDLMWGICANNPCFKPEELTIIKHAFQEVIARLDKAN